MKKLVSVVIPCFNEQEVILETISRLLKVCNENISYDFELLFIDDGSKDQTFPLLQKVAAQEARVRLIRFARNFGHQTAVTAGMDAASGDAVILIDADLQDPPELISQMLEKWQAGYDVVYCVRSERHGESWFKKVTAKMFYRLLNKLSNTHIPLDTGDFRLISRNVAEALRQMPERDRFVRGLVSWVGFQQTSLLYKRDKRFAGESKYPLKKMVRFALDGMLSFSSKPLEIAVSLGAFSSGLALLGIFYAIFMRIFTNIWVEGWTALIIAVLFLGGVQLMCIGIVGTYVGRIYNEVKGRPLYIVSEYIGFKAQPPTYSRSPLSSHDK